MAAATGYPVRFDVAYPEVMNRWLPLVKWILIYPQVIVLSLLYFCLAVAVWIAFVSILSTGKFPKDIFQLAAGIYRWNANVTSYQYLMRDEYPPFSWGADLYPVSYEADYSENLNRWLPLIKWFIALPHYAVLLVLTVMSYFVWLLALLSILFTRRYPRGLFNFIVGYQRWFNRVLAYVGLMRDEYPPFSLSA